MASEVVVRGSDGTDTTFNIPHEAFTVLELKQKIAESRGTAAADQRLLYGGQMLQDQRTLQSYNINDGFVIRLLVSVPTPGASTQSLHALATAPAPPAVLANVFVSAAAAGGSTLTFNHVPANTTVQNFKEMIYERTGDNPENIRLIYAGKEFEDVRAGTVMSLLDYGVTKDATLHMVYRLPGGGRE